MGEGGWKQEAIKQQKKVYKTFIISWSSFTGKFIKRFALLLLLKLMNETVTDIYFYNFIFKVLVFARHQAEPLLFNCQEFWWGFLSSMKSLVFREYKYLYVISADSPFVFTFRLLFGKSIIPGTIISWLHVHHKNKLSSDTIFIIRRRIFHGRNLLIFTLVSSEFEQFSFLKYFCLITKQQITWFIVWELIWQWGKTQIYQEKCISRDKF